jgi:hypothetical protein
MANLLDYLDWRGDLAFDADHMNELDCLMFSWLSYVDFEGIVPHEFARAVTLKKASAAFLEKNNLEKILSESLSFTRTAGLALKKAAETVRFAKVKLFGYRNEIDYDHDSQFAAVTAQIDPRTAVIIFRGTDDSIVGWKEDFNMCFMPEVPAQKKAFEYLKEAASKVRGNLYICGHSKGGNLAVFSAANVKPGIQNRIIRIYNFDGPGFGDKTILGPNAENIFKKTESYTPTESIVGMLLNHVSDYHVVRSTQKSVMQHDVLSWMLVGTHFVTVDEVESKSLAFDETMKNWLKQMTDEEREKFIDSLFKILSANEAKTTMDISADFFKSVAGMLKEYTNLSKEARNMLKKFTGVFIKEGSESLKKRKRNQGKLTDK